MRAQCRMGAVSGVECRPGCRDMPLYAAICRALERKLLIFLRLGFFFGNSAAYWMHLQSEYEIGLVQANVTTRLHMIQPSYMDEEKLKAGTSDTSPTADKSKPKNIRKRIMR